MDAFLYSTAIVALAEMGDKTQLLALILAARFKKPVPIVLGIFVATVLNHMLAGALGAWVSALVSTETLNIVLSLTFIAMAIWMLIPDKMDEDEVKVVASTGVFLATVVVFFLAEMGDKTQIATVALAAHYSDALWVVVGSTLGMMVANALVVFFGERITRVVPVTLMQRIVAVLFLALGVFNIIRVWSNVT